MASAQPFLTSTDSVGFGRADWTSRDRRLDQIGHTGSDDHQPMEQAAHSNFLQMRLPRAIERHCSQLRRTMLLKEPASGFYTG